MSLSSRLNCRIDVYGKKDYINALGEDDYIYEKLKSIYAEITPSGGSLLSGEGNTTHADISHKFVIRSNSISNLSNDMYFIFKAQRYDIKYFNPNYKYRDRIEIFCSLIME
ncbi:phage head completion protein [Aminipila terrae]|uniref:Head-tail adaptor protein n=1 Tax=Aminipila terrae TaxID=2697030 RepID=A0A6P1MIQ3_9FIRM|nr:head-tail adaptor protein [Aminipila terrae]QHI73787.1 head-tail adaptor protein [Aminipila terrae]